MFKHYIYVCNPSYVSRCLSCLETTQFAPVLLWCHLSAVGLACAVSAAERKKNSIVFLEELMDDDVARRQRRCALPPPHLNMNES